MKQRSSISSKTITIIILFAGTAILTQMIINTEYHRKAAEYKKIVYKCNQIQQHNRELMQIKSRDFSTARSYDMLKNRHYRKLRPNDIITTVYYNTEDEKNSFEKTIALK